MRPWTRPELLLAMNLYCRLPFGRLHQRNPEIIQLAAALDRTPSSVAMKLSNLASLDPAHQARGVKGLTGASAADRRVWEEFHADWTARAAESELLRTQYQLDAVPPEAEPSHPPAASETTDDVSDRFTFTGPTEAERTTTVRLAQRFFRRTVLASFESKCCVTGIAHPALLIASHIVPWSRSPEHRANPRNGLCLSRLHDAAFDQGLITFDEDYRLVLSRALAEHCTNDVLRGSFGAFEGQCLTIPPRFRPDQTLLQLHRETVYCY